MSQLIHITTPPRQEWINKEGLAERFSHCGEYTTSFVEDSNHLEAATCEACQVFWRKLMAYRLHTGGAYTDPWTHQIRVPFIEGPPVS